MCAAPWRLLLTLAAMAASSSSAAAAAPESAGVVPQWMIDLVCEARPVCKFFATKHGCRKGMKCTKLHDADPTKRTNRALLPYVSRYRTPEGEDRLVLRPPLHGALEQCFKEAGKPLCCKAVSNGSTRAWI